MLKLKSIDYFTISIYFVLGSKLVLLLILAVSAALSGAYLYLAPETPSADKLLDVKLQYPMKVYTADHTLIAQYGEQRRESLVYDQLPAPLVQAVLAAEDDAFFYHNGVDVPALVRAVISLATSGGRITRGGGTVTMQVARNYLLGRQQTFLRKFREILLALRLEDRLTKEEIFSLYANGIFLGNRIYGFAVASEIYFDKPIAELTAAEAALLAAIPKSPSRINPIASPSRARVRRNWVLRRMQRLGYLTPAELRAATEEKVRVPTRTSTADSASGYSAEMVRLKVLNSWGQRMYREGYRVYSTVDADLQEAATYAVRRALTDYDRRHGFRNPENIRIFFGSDIEALLDQQGYDYSHFRKLVEIDEDGEPVPVTASVTQLLERVEKERPFGKAIPSVVLNVARQNAIVLTSNGELKLIPWSADLTWARRFIDENTTGPVPSRMTDILIRGDIVYVERKEDSNSLVDLVQVPEVEGGFVVLDAHSGAIKAMVGGFDFQRSQFNRVTQTRVQAGSVFKPFVYSAAFSLGKNPATVVDDAPVVISDGQLEEDWRPKNSSGRFFGPTRLREALVHSRNLVSIRLMRELGVRRMSDIIAETFDFERSRLAKDLSLSLGNVELTPLEMSVGYSVFANGGYIVEPKIVDRVVDRNNRVVWRSTYNSTPNTRLFARPEPLEGERDARVGLNAAGVTRVNKFERADKTLDERIAYQMTSLMKDVMTRGTAAAAKSINRSDFSGKTGTTNDSQYTWFCTFNGQYVMVAYVGFDQSYPLGNKEFGAVTALPIWKYFMEEVGEKVAFSEVRKPSGIASARIDPISGEWSKQGDQGYVFEWFKEEDLPAEDVQATLFREVRPEDIF